MPTCPRCHQAVDTQAIACPYCRTTLKAHGHPGIPLYRADGDDYLCQSCTYHADDTCNFPQRPYAKECTLYQNQFQAQASTPTYRPRLSTSVKTWIKQNAVWIVLVGLVVVSVLIALSSA